MMDVQTCKFSLCVPFVHQALPLKGRTVAPLPIFWGTAAPQPPSLFMLSYPFGTHILFVLIQAPRLI